MMHLSFTPRPIYSVKPYNYIVEEGDTPTKIAARFGRKPAAVRELVAANLYGRVLQPALLGSPYSFRSFAGLEVGEELLIPSHWPDPVGVLNGPAEAALLFDPLTQGFAKELGALQAKTGGQAVPAPMVAPVLNAAMQWWLQKEGTTVPADPAAYDPYLQKAIAWTEAYGNTMPAEQAAVFPWAPLLAMLPGVDPTTAAWTTGVVPGTSGARWADFPWAYLGSLGPSLETLKLPPINWPPTKDAASLLAAFTAAIAGATYDAHVCGKNAEKGPGGKCFCAPGYTWVKDKFDPQDPTSLDCKPDPEPQDKPPSTTPPGPPAPPPPSGQQCPSGTTYDALGPSGPSCYGCPTGFTYTLAMHTCTKPAAPPAPPSTTTPPTPAPAAPEEKPDHTKLIIGAVVVVAAIAAVTTVAVATSTPTKESTP